MRSCVTKTAAGGHPRGGLPRALPLALAYHTHNVDAAATGAQKRALQPHQISPSTKVPPGGGAAAAASVNSNSGGSSNNNNLVMGAAVAAGAAGAGYYYYTTTIANTTINTKTTTDDATGAAMDTNGNTTVTTQKEKAAEVSNGVKDTPVIPSTPSSDETKVTSNNRVTTIQVPSKMKNRHPAPAVVEEHPPQGNRVVTIVSPPPVSPATTAAAAVPELPLSSSSTTSTAAMESLIASHSSVWSTHSNSQQQPPPQSTMEQLQQRIGQLQMELQDRTKWEAIRLKEFLIMKEREVTDQYVTWCRDCRCICGCGW